MKGPPCAGLSLFCGQKKGAVLPAHSFVPTPFISQLIVLMKSHPAIVPVTVLSDPCLSLDTGVILGIYGARTSQSYSLKLRTAHQGKIININ